MWDALAYPTRGKGWLILLPGAVLGVGMTMGSIFGMQAMLFPLELGRDLGHIGRFGYSMIGTLALTTTFFLAVLMPGLAYFATYYFRVIRGTMSGKPLPPDWPSWTELLEDPQTPLAVMGAWVFSFLPVLAYYWCSSTEEATPVALVCDWLGAALFTVAMLGYVSHDNLWREIPIGMIQVFFLPVVAWGVPATLLFGIRLLAYGFFSDCFLANIWAVPLGCLLIAWFVPVHGRLMGRIYLKHQGRLEW